MAKRRRSKSTKPQRSARSLSSLDRRSRNYKPRESILIVCEGLQTEPNYFQSLRRELRLSSVEVQIEGEGAAPITVVERAIRLQNERKRQAKKSGKKGDGKIIPFDEIWCVFDVEDIVHNPSFHRAVAKAQAKSFHLAISNPAFEYWYLLHFKDTSRPFRNASDLLKALKQKDGFPNYEKNKDVFYELLPYMKSAIERAARILSNHPNQDEPFPNPSTFVFRLVLKLKKMAGR
jgi:hypothetical protein